MTKQTLLLLLILCGGVGCTALNPALRIPPEKPPEPPLSMDGEDLSYIHPLQPPRREIARLALTVPQSLKDHTYLFFINGLDPYYLANFRGQCQYMKTLGYGNAFCGQMSQTPLFRQKINDVRQEDPQARIVVIGYSTGANFARTLANLLKDDGVRLDLLVYLGGDTIKDIDSSRPSNVGHILNITAHGFILLGGDLIFAGDEIKGASNHRLDARHFLLPTRAEAVELLVAYVVALNRGMLPERNDATIQQASFKTRGSF